MKKAVLYIRVSTQEQVLEGVSLDAQEERLKTYCQLAGLEVVEIIKEEGVSASKPLADRPGGQKLVKLIAQGKAYHVVALKLDRLFRDTVDALQQTHAWDKAGVALHLVDMGGQTIDTSTAMGRFFLNMMAGFAELERNLIAERTELALQYKKAQRKAYSPTPYGYDRVGNDLIPNHQEQEIIRQIKAWRENGQTLQGIADQLNNTGVATKQGGRWYPATVKYILENDLYKEEVA